MSLSKHPHLRRRAGRTAAAALASALLAACGFQPFGDGGHGGAGALDVEKEGWYLRATGRQAGPGNYAVGAEAFASCTAAETYLEDQVVAELERQAASQIRWIKDYDADGSYGGDPDVQADAAAPGTASNGSGEAPAADAASGAAAPESGAGGSGAAPTSFTTGNDQIAGVEEGDIVKTDGLHVFQVAGGRLHILATWPADTMRTIASLELSGRPFHILLDDEHRVVVLSTPFPEASSGDDDVPVASGSGFMPSPTNGSVLVDVVDVSDATAPTITKTFTVAGYYTGVRRVGSHLRLTLADQLRYPPGIEWYPRATADNVYLDYSNYDRWSKARKIAWIRGALARNVALVRAQSLAAWLPEPTLTDAQGGTTSFVPDCARMHAPKAPVQLGVTRVVSIDLDAATIEQTLLLAQTSQLYASETGLYLTTPFYWWDQEARNEDLTYVHRFDTAESGDTTYVGSGSVAGLPLDQFSFDEHEGFLRVATTITRRQGDDDTATWETVNRVSVLGLADGELKESGRTPDLAAGERLFAARFMGDFGYVVTFRQVDPLFTLDLSDPTAPKVVGELKIPGFSTYLHPIGGGKLLALGRDADEQTGQTRGLKLSVFDVTDPAAPREAHALTLAGDVWTDAQWDHRAFTWHAARGVLGIPTMSSNYAANGSWEAKSGVNLYRVDADAGITELGALDMSDVTIGDETDPTHPWKIPASVSRSLFADDVVYAVSNIGVRAADLGDLEHPLATVTYECKDGGVECFIDAWPMVCGDAAVSSTPVSGGVAE
jgi:hypothetical protein